ncbi:MAG: type II secretion system protein [Phycisphaerae bacterium]|nr:type II secretion system protein [Phycisphaerae bacterium]
MRKQKGFTLIKLLVVIAIIAQLLSLIIPGLNMAKRKASMVADLANVKSTSLAWYMYQGENNGLICSLTPQNAYPWVKNPVDTAGNTPSLTQVTPIVTDEDEKRGISKGVLFEYIKNADVFHCPMDQRKSLYDLSNIFRTYSMPAYLNWSGTLTGTNEIHRFGKIVGPGTKIMLVEEADMRNYNNGAWSFGAPEWTGGGLEWWDPLAVTHGDGSTLGFCDGPAENHKWVDPFTKDRPNKLAKTGTTNYGREAPPAGHTTDIQYIYSGWGYRKK